MVAAMKLPPSFFIVAGFICMGNTSGIIIQVRESNSLHFRQYRDPLLSVSVIDLEKYITQ